MRVTGALFPVTSGQDYVAGAPFSFALPRVILRETAKALSAVAESLFSYGPLPYDVSSNFASADFRKIKTYNF